MFSYNAKALNMDIRAQLKNKFISALWWTNAVMLNLLKQSPPFLYSPTYTNNDVDVAIYGFLDFIWCHISVVLTPDQE